jgi:hypothetical protein
VGVVGAGMTITESGMWSRSPDFRLGCSGGSSQSLTTCDQICADPPRAAED